MNGYMVELNSCISYVRLIFMVILIYRAMFYYIQGWNSIKSVECSLLIVVVTKLSGSYYSFILHFDLVQVNERGISHVCVRFSLARGDKSIPKSHFPGQLWLIRNRWLEIRTKISTEISVSTHNSINTFKF